MSVLIKGMEMPESCCVCPVNMERCNYGYEYLRDHPELYERRAENCPIVEVPTPHSALIDRDKLTGEQYKDGHIMVVEMDAIEDAPTVIEAEE